MNKREKLRSRRGRNYRGSVLVTGGLLIVLVAMFLICVANMGLLTMTYVYDSASVESAALAAASDISRIIMNDKRYGFVSLQGYPALGKATLSGDGLPTEVSSINSIIASTRLENLVAHSVDSPELIALADDEWINQHKVVMDLNKFLQGALTDSAMKYIDANGESVSPYSHAKQLLLANLKARLKPGEQAEIRNLKLTLGWSSSQTSSEISLPEEEKNAKTIAAMPGKEKYAAFVNIPGNGKSFYFAGLGSTSSVVKSELFREPDGQRCCSIVKVEVDIRVHSLGEGNKNWFTFLGPIFENGFVHHIACAKAHSASFTRIPGVLTLDITQGVPAEISCLGDFLNVNPDATRNTMITTSVNGDIGYDLSASIQPSAIEFGGQNPSPSQVFADAIHIWLRRIGAQVKLESVLCALRTPFKSVNNRPSAILSYELDSNGVIHVMNREHSPFNSFVRTEGQTFGYCPFVTNESKQQGVAYVQARCAHVGITNGGKHAGQPMPSQAANWSELEYYSGSLEQAKQMGTGGSATQMEVRGPAAVTPSNELIPGSVASEGAVFYSNSGTLTKRQPRSNYYSGGEIVSISMAPAFMFTRHGLRR